MKTYTRINILDKEILLSQFADDRTFLLDSTRESFCTCMCVLQQFVSKSGLNINVDKTKAVWRRITKKLKTEIYARN